MRYSVAVYKLSGFVRYVWSLNWESLRMSCRTWYVPIPLTPSPRCFPFWGRKEGGAGGGDSPGMGRACSGVEPSLEPGWVGAATQGISSKDFVFGKKQGRKVYQISSLGKL